MMKLVKRSALILPSSPGEGIVGARFSEDLQADSAISIDWASFNTRPICQATGDDSPSPWGEGRGEGGTVKPYPLKSTH